MVEEALAEGEVMEVVATAADTAADMVPPEEADTGEVSEVVVAEGMLLTESVNSLFNFGTILAGVLSHTGLQAKENMQPVCGFTGRWTDRSPASTLSSKQ